MRSFLFHSFSSVDDFVSFVGDSMIAQHVRAIKNLGTSFGVTICELYEFVSWQKLICFASQSAVANKRDDNIKSLLSCKAKLFTPNEGSYICVFNALLLMNSETFFSTKWSF